MAQLGAEHEQITGLSGKVRRALALGEIAEAATALAALAELLGPHSALEEAGLYPELTSYGIAADGFYADHVSIDVAIETALRGEAGAWEEVPKALDRLDRHIHVEEYDLFPAAHQLLSDAAWDRIDAPPP